MKRYRHYCAVAKALDVVGERWTLLIVRQLLLGGRRYSQLLEGLPGMGTNVLAQRLRHLERFGLVERGSDGVYELTPTGRQLGPVIAALARWGMHLLAEPDADDVYRPEWLMTGLRGTFDGAAARGLNESYEIHIGDYVFHADIQDGKLDLSEGPSRLPAVVVNLDAPTLLALGSGRLSPRDAVESGAVHVLGGIDAFERCITVLNGRRRAIVTASN